MPDVTRSQRWCAATMRAHASSFYLATRLLPSRKRHAIEALYGFCRFADDAADEPGPSAQERSATFDAIRADLEAIAAGGAGTLPWFAAVARAFDAYPLRLADAFELVAGCQSDLGTVDVATLEQLERYAAAVAGTVGRFTIAVLGASDDDSLRRATLLGVAMQLTNVLRDVEEDWKAGRNYLPHRSFPGVGTSQLMAALAARARAYYREADVLAVRVPNDGSRVAIVLARTMYEGILDAIDARRYDWRRGRAVVRRAEKLRMTLRSLLTAYVGLPTIK